MGLILPSVINQQEGDNRVYLRLDRTLATSNWLEHFSNIKVQHLEDTMLDHCPLLLADSNTFKDMESSNSFLRPYRPDELTVKS